MWHCDHQTKDLDWIIRKSDYLYDLDEKKIKQLEGNTFWNMIHFEII